MEPSAAPAVAATSAQSDAGPAPAGWADSRCEFTAEEFAVLARSLPLNVEQWAVLVEGVKRVLDQRTSAKSRPLSLKGVRAMAAAQAFARRPEQWGGKSAACAEAFGSTQGMLKYYQEKLDAPSQADATDGVARVVDQPRTEKKLRKYSSKKDS